MLSILVASKHGTAPGGLTHLPAHRLLIDNRAGWALAANALLDEAARLGDDAIFVDDDATFTAGSLANLGAASGADLIGLTMLNHDDTVASCGHIYSPLGMLVPRALGRAHTPCELAHVTTSCIWLSARALQSGLRFPVWPGIHGEDVAFTYDAWLRGLRVAYVPGPVIHPVHAGQVGATKQAEPNLHARIDLNARHLAAWCQTRDVAGAVARGIIPLGERAIAQEVAA